MIKFSKMQGAGNDFVVVNLWEQDIKDLSDLAKKMCDRHFGIGADGLMAVRKSDASDVQMIYYNSDGSRGEMCGNGIRCFSKYVFDKKIINKENFTVETLAGEKVINLKIMNSKVDKVMVDMGAYTFDPKRIPVKTEQDEFLLEKIKVHGEDIKISCMLMGVPHAVVFVDEIDPKETIGLGSEIEIMDLFPQKINVNFVQVVNRSKILVDTWERGAGKTLACGTGACASVTIANKLGYVDEDVHVEVAGGNLKINIHKDNRVMMEGAAAFICDGNFCME